MHVKCQWALKIKIKFQCYNCIIIRTVTFKTVSTLFTAHYIQLKSVL